MENIQEKIDILDRMFEHICGGSPAIRYEEDQINIANGTLVIYDTEVELKSIRGIIKAPGYGLGRTETRQYHPSDPPDVDFGEIAVHVMFLQIAKAAVVAWVEMQLDSHIDFLNTEAQAKELFG